MIVKMVAASSLEIPVMLLNNKLTVMGSIENCSYPERKFF
jgi:hypothetical protein